MKSEKIRIGSFCFSARDCILSSYPYFGEDIFYKVLWVSSLDQAFLKIFYFSSNEALEDFVRRGLSASL